MRLIKKYFSDIFSLKTFNNEVAELGVRLIAECALQPNNYGILFNQSIKYLQFRGKDLGARRDDGSV